MIVAEANKTCRWILTYDTAHLISVHLLVCYTNAKCMDMQHIKTAQSDYSVLIAKLS